MGQTNRRHPLSIRPPIGPIGPPGCRFGVGRSRARGCGAVHRHPRRHRAVATTAGPGPADARRQLHRLPRRWMSVNQLAVSTSPRTRVEYADRTTTFVLVETLHLPDQRISSAVEVPAQERSLGGERPGVPLVTTLVSHASSIAVGRGRRPTGDRPVLPSMRFSPDGHIGTRLPPGSGSRPSACSASWGTGRSSPGRHHSRQARDPRRRPISCAAGSGSRLRVQRRSRPGSPPGRSAGR